jgi:hypothetical protein
MDSHSKKLLVWSLALAAIIGAACAWVYWSDDLERPVRQMQRHKRQTHPQHNQWHNVAGQEGPEHFDRSIGRSAPTATKLAATEPEPEPEPEPKPEKETTLFTQEREFKKRRLFIYCDSDNYDAATGKLQLVFDLRNVLSFELYSCSIPKGAYIINANNNQFTFRAGGTDTTIQLDVGDYDALTLAAHIQAQVRALAVRAAFTCSYEALTTSLVCTDSSEFEIEFLSTHPSLQYSLGFATQTNTSADQDGTQTLRAPNRLDLFHSRYLQIRGLDMKRHYVNTDIIGTVDLVNDINYNRGFDQHFEREFPVPIERWKKLTLQLEQKMPYTAAEPFQNNGLAFHMCFCVTVLTTNIKRNYHDIVQ